MLNSLNGVPNVYSNVTNPYSNNVTQGTSQVSQAATNPVKNKDGKNVKKALAISSAAIAAVGVAAIAITKGNGLKKAKNFLQDLVKNAKRGSNEILSEAIKHEDYAVKNFADTNPEGWQKLKDTVLDMVEIKNADEVLPDGVVYHGTSFESAKNILKKGVTPFSEKRVGSGSGVGYGFYTTSSLDAAKFYSNNQTVLPYKLDGKVAVLKDGIKPDDIKERVMGQVTQIIDPPNQTNSSLFFYHPNEEATSFAKDNQSYIVTKLMQELGIDALCSKGATTRGGLLGIFNNAPEYVDDALQVAIYNGKSVNLDADAFLKMNPVTKDNYYRILK